MEWVLEFYQKQNDWSGVHKEGISQTNRENAALIEELADGQIGYKRRDKDLWIIHGPSLGWIALIEGSDQIGGRPCDMLPADKGDHPPPGDWISKKGAKSYVYKLVYCTPPR